MFFPSLLKLRPPSCLLLDPSLRPCSELQGRRGSGRKLADLSAERLGRRIQAPGRRHSPREDAQAAMDLYLREVHFRER